LRIVRGAAAVVLGGALAVGTAVVGPAGTALAAPPGAAQGEVRWTADLQGGEAAGVEVTRDGVRLARERAAALEEALHPDGHGDSRSPGLLTLSARPLPVPAGRVEATLDVPRDAVAAGDAAVDVRGLRADGGWTEWVPAEPPPGARRRDARTVQAVLPDPATRVQARLVLTPTAGRDPRVRGLTLTAYPAPREMRTQAPRTPQRHRVFATREGLVGRTTANGHRIVERDLFVALPSRRALSPRNTGDYAVKVCAPTGRCAFAPVWDVGPWNTRDDYWNPSPRRQNWRDLPQGLPQAQAAKREGHNGGRDQFGRVVRNPAGIDLADGLFWDGLGLRDNAWVTVEYLWTGDSPLASVRVDGRVDLRNAPNPRARVVGLVADRAAVPVQCVQDGWLRVGTGQFLPATSVPRALRVGQLPRCGR
jgi:hypothetical protein